MKKIIALLLVLTVASSMVACGNSSTPAVSEPASQVEESVSAPEETPDAPAESEAASESEDESSDAEATALVFPDLDGFTKDVQSTMGIDMTLYQAEDNSVIVVMGLPGDETSQQLFASKDAQAEAMLNEIGTQALSQQLAQIAPDFKAEGKFETVEGKDAFVITGTIPKEQAGAAGADINIHYYTIATSDSIYNVMGFSVGTDTMDGIKSIIAVIP